jgi:hypothetical protein
MSIELFIALLSLAVGVLGTAHAVKESKHGQIALYGILLVSALLYAGYSLGTLQNARTSSVQDSAIRPLLEGESLPAQGPIPQGRRETIYSGEWQLRVMRHHLLDPSAQRRARGGSYEIMVGLNHGESRVAGEYRWASDGACPRAMISGKLAGDTLEAVVTYHGPCCPGLRMRLSGTFVTHDRFQGMFEPIDTPPVNCTAWWADVEGSRV